MAKMHNNRADMLSPGTYQVLFNAGPAGTGTGELQASKDQGETWQALAGCVFIESGDVTKQLGGGNYRAVLSGGGRMWVDKV